MKLKVDRKAFIKAFKPIASVADDKSTLPIVANVLIRTVDSKLFIAATDLNLSVSTLLDIETDEGGFTVPAKSFLNAISKFTTNEVSISVEKNDRIKLTAGKARLTLGGSSIEHFPKLPSPNDVEYIEIKPSILKDLFLKSVYAASDDTIRYNLNGCFLEFSNSCLVSVATDGARISIAKTKLDIPDMKGIIVPKIGVLTMIKMLEGETASIGLSGDYVFLNVNGYVISVKTIPASFPDYNKIIPSYSNSFTIEKSILQNAFVLAEAVNDETVTVEMGNNNVSVIAKNEPTGSYREDIDVESIGEQAACVVRPKYFIEYLSKLEGKTVNIKYGGDRDPIFFEGDDSSYLGIIAPKAV